MAFKEQLAHETFILKITELSSLQDSNSNGNNNSNNNSNTLGQGQRIGLFNQPGTNVRFLPGY